MKIVLAGGSGFLGSAILEHFGDGHEFVVLSRAGSPIRGARSVRWDAKAPGDWSKELDGADLLINLTGESVAQRWTDEVRARLRSSRLDSTRVLGKAIADCENPPPRWINASGVGYYGETGDREVDEGSPPGEDMMSRLCVEWEGTMFDSPTPRTHKCAVRIGFVLGKGGGAYDTLWKLTRRFMGAAVGSGRNWIPWIHLEDLISVFRFCANNEVHVVNGVGAAPVTMNEFMAAMRRSAHRPWIPNVPTPVARTAELFGSPPVDLAIQSSRVVSSVLRTAAFSYRFTDLNAALDDLARTD